MFQRSASFGALLAVAIAAPAFAAVAQAPAATPRPAAPAAQRPAQGAQAMPNRAAVVRNLNATFKSLDTNGDSSLNQAELAAAESRSQQQRLAAARQRMDAQFTKLDTNRNGQIDKAEFMAAGPQAPAPATGANILAQVDKNKDGKVTLDEYGAPILSRFDRADANKDGTISQAERQAATRTNQAQRRN